MMLSSGESPPLECEYPEPRITTFTTPQASVLEQLLPTALDHLF